MLMGIDHRLNADVLYALRAMGHGDLIVLVDLNFPADQVARSTVLGRLLRMENLTLAEAAEVVLSVFPLDTFVDDFARRIEVVGAPDEIPPVQQEAQRVLEKAKGGQCEPMIGTERFQFYDLARQAYAIIETGERRFYGCAMFRKGVIPPDAK